MNTKTALTKLTDAQRSTLDTYRAYMKEDYHGNGVKYRYSIYGYITALHESGVLTAMELRLLKIYFTLWSSYLRCGSAAAAHDGTQIFQKHRKERKEMEKAICYGMTELSLSLFRANTDQEEKAAEAAYDEAQKAIEADYLPFFSALVSGEIDFFQYETGKNCHLFTRSARTGVAVQMTIFWNRDGELLPLSHRNINSFSDMVREGIADNVTITAA